jgi:uncharacterized membrane protein YoaK (UPF0700 family)
VAGSANAVGLLELNAFASNMTGNITRLAESIGRRSGPELSFYLPMVVAFVVGAMTATLFVERAKLLGRARYVVALLLEASLLTAFTLVTELVPDERHPWLASALRATLCFSMGLQNALVTKISGAVVRTTHLTGMLTDFSIEAVRLMFWVRQRLRGQKALDQLWELSRIARDPEVSRARLHLTILLSFVAAGALGTALYLHYGRVAMALPVTVLLTLVFYDRAIAARIRAAPPAPARDVNANVSGSLESAR